MKKQKQALSVDAFSSADQAWRGTSVPSLGSVQIRRLLQCRGLPLSVNLLAQWRGWRAVRGRRAVGLERRGAPLEWRSAHSSEEEARRARAELHKLSRCPSLVLICKQATCSSADLPPSSVSPPLLHQRWKFSWKEML